MESFAEGLTDMHDKEIFIYEQLYKSHAHFYLPKVYAWKHCSERDRTKHGLTGACMIMEDLGINGAMGDMIVGMTKGQVRMP